MQCWFPIGVWLKTYDWRGAAPADLIAAVSVAALLIPESMAPLRWSIEGRGSSRLSTVGVRSDRFGEFIESCRHT